MPRNICPGRLLLTMIMIVGLVLSGSVPVVSGQASEENPEGPTGLRTAVHTLQPFSELDAPASSTFVAPLGGREPQLVLGPDERVQVDDTTQDPYKQIVHLIAIDEDAGVGQRCTGTVIGPRVVMTAAHCIWTPDFDGYPDSVEVIPGRNGDQTPFGSGFAASVWVPQGWIDSLSDGDLIPNWELDYALVVMTDDSLGLAVGAMTLGVLDDAALTAADFNPTTAGYPGDKPEGTLWRGSGVAFTDVTATHLFHTIDSVAGQSGSALWRGADELIVGIDSLETDTENVALRITQPIIDDFTVICEEAGCAFNVATAGNGPPVDDSAFLPTWERTDRPVAEGQAVRTWMWGPEPHTPVITETYDEAPGGQRAVQYYDKSRMEITQPEGDPNSIWYVTNGLLATELITGRMQLGDSRFETRAPATVNVAGDASDPSGPTYASFNAVLGAAAQPVAAPLTQRIDRSGVVTDDPALGGQGLAVGNVDDITNHGIAAPFWDFMNSSGVIYQNGSFATAPLFEDPYFATGRPITEPYWAEVLVGGTPKLVLIQCFERRCLTYTPDNAPEWRVEMSNIGQHYYAWRNSSADDGPPPPAAAPVDSCLDAEEAELLTLLNTYREQFGRETFSNSAILNATAYDHSLDMGRRGYYDHLTPEGATPQERAEGAGYEGLVAENIAAAVETAAEVVQRWQDEAGTDANLLSDTVAVGIGRVYVEGSPWGWYWTVEFGDVADAPPNGCG